MVLISLLTVLLPQSATAESSSSAGAAGTVSAEPLCGTPKPGAFSCFSFRRTDVRQTLGLQRAGDAAPAGLSPADLHSAYNLPANGGAGTTIAIIDAYDDPAAEADLAVYRQQYGLTACTAQSGCFRKVDQRGGVNYPEPDGGWAGEISLDLDMVSAIAPDANIMLVEADDNSTESLGAAVNTAVALGAQYISNSYGAYTDDPSEPATDAAYFDHPGTALVFSSGDGGYGVTYPASSPYVTSVGGTSLTRDSGSRGWSESVWNSAVTHADGSQSWGAPGSGCSQAEDKPAFQTDSGCAGRSVADVSAVADPRTGVAVYNSYSDGGWNIYGGTSAAAPIIAGTYALAGRPVIGTYPNSYPYSAQSALNDVTTGDNASCPDSSLCNFGTTPHCDPAYLCAAQPGYDGPTGLGTPNGVAAFKSGPHGSVHGTVTDATTGKPIADAAIDLGDYHAVSGKDGSYRLDVPAGDYPAKVGAFGYADQDLGALHLPDDTDLVKDIALIAIPSQAISGTVKDSGHGWGVYAKITLDGMPGETYSDPATGAYQITVPMNRDYKVNVSPLAAGYQPTSRTVSVTDKPVTGVDLVPPMSDHGTLPAGYQITYHGGEQQHFDAPSTPGGWTVKNNTTAGGWQFDDPLNRGNQTGGTGHFAQVDDFALGWFPVDTELISPLYDFSKEKAPQLDFESALPPTYRIDDATADVDISTDGGAVWTNVWHHDDVVAGPSHESVALDTYAGKSSVRIRFHFTGSLTGIWEVDDVAIGTRSLQALPGGLLVGHVTDSNTTAGVPGAMVTSNEAPAETTRAVVSPGDPALGDGAYWLFSSLTGKRNFTADLSSFGYPAVSSKVNVAANKATAADFVLHPAKLTSAESSVSAPVAWGNSKSVNVTLTNTGASPVTFSLGEQRLGSGTTQATASPGTSAPSKITLATTMPRPALKTNAAPTASTTARSAATAAGQSWQSLTDLPEAVKGGLAAVNNGVLYTGLGATMDGIWSTDFRSYDQSSGTWKQLASPVTLRYVPAYGFIRGKLYVTGGRDRSGVGIRSGEVYDPASNTWSQIAEAPLGFGSSGSGVVGDKLYVIGGCTISTGCGTNDVQIYNPVTDSWTSGKPYPERVSYPSCGTVEGTLICAGGGRTLPDGSEVDTASTYQLNAATGVWKRVADAPGDFWGGAGTSADGRLLVAGGVQDSTNTVLGRSYAYDPADDSWSALPGLPQPLALAQAAPGWYVIGGVDADGVNTATAIKLPGLDAAHTDVPWLSESATSLTLKGGKSVTVKLTLDATAMGATDYGDHHAALVVDSDTPYASVTLPVTMSVTAPAGWGQLSGTVTGATSGGAVPLPGAVVEVDSKNGDTTLTTDARGGYRLWRPVSDGNLTIIVAADTYRPATRTVKLVKGGTVTADFALAPR
ncbi:carboxypeptidase regulatory-like domain-containing protein [Streptomyces sp. NPDC088354]|uniref:carboxypeptidase regulatory-like domain-containing protein n=1 Tax=Streptomyces sp. NPDC088354 TaxID=3365856 RepID=UPI003821AB69